ncbi:MAG: YbaB/EbfC family nucleoid-associated protein [Gammaproteobacteria bacterium]|nr:YbaB/EbfC family nucleoid-associated protein [Gammaproteobacteria bacterium]
MFNKSQLGGLMKQAQMVKDNLKKAKEQLAQLEVVGESGGGKIKVIMAGDRQVKRVVIAEALGPDDKDWLEDLLVVAINDANHKVEDLNRNLMQSVAPGLPPDLQNML